MYVSAKRHADVDGDGTSLRRVFMIVAAICLIATAVWIAIRVREIERCHGSDREEVRK
jgi:HAMP domain-containing protein